MRDRTLWTWHIGAGLVILVLLGIHMTIMHLNATLGFVGLGTEEPTAWASVAARASSAFFTITYVLLLGAALYHGFYGFRNILMELNPAKALRTLIDLGLTAIGLALFAFGTWAALAAPGAATMGG
jgi:succinate dehydrogenase / fumarate reductase membrane anchor subunit